MRRRDDQLVEVLGVPDVARVHDHEAAVEPGVARPLVLLGLRCDRRGVDPVRDHDHTLGRRALCDQPLAHPLSDRHDRVRSTQVEADEGSERRDHQWVRQPPELGRDLGEDVLADHQQRHASPTSDQEAEIADDRRIGHAEHEVRARDGARPDEAVQEIGDVVHRPEPELRPVEGGRACPEHAHAVQHLFRRKLGSGPAAVR